MKLHYLKLTPQLLIESILIYAMWIVYNWRSRPPLKQQRGRVLRNTSQFTLLTSHPAFILSTTKRDREHSTYELTSPLQLSERSTDIDLVREAVHQKRSLRTRKASETRLSRGNSRWEKASHFFFLQKYSLREEGVLAKRTSICRSTSANTSTDELDRISVVTTEERLRNIQVELFLWMDKQYKRNCKSLPFFYFLTFEKADCPIFTLSVGRSVSRSTSPLIFFNIWKA